MWEEVMNCCIFNSQVLSTKYNYTDEQHKQYIEEINQKNCDDTNRHKNDSANCLLEAEKFISD
jgi:hemerythrin